MNKMSQTSGSLENLPYDMKLEVLKQIKDIDVLRSICSTSKSFRDICKQNWKQLIDKIEPKISVVSLENYETNGYKEFRSERNAIQYFKNQIKEHLDVLREYNMEYYMSKDVLAGMIKLTYTDYSDKIRSFLLCGLSRFQNKKVIEELEQELKETSSSNSNFLSDETFSDSEN